jgi:hypothetical protein
MGIICYVPLDFLTVGHSQYGKASSVDALNQGPAVTICSFMSIFFLVKLHFVLLRLKLPISCRCRLSSRYGPATESPIFYISGSSLCFTLYRSSLSFRNIFPHGSCMPVLTVKLPLGASKDAPRQIKCVRPCFNKTHSG